MTPQANFMLVAPVVAGRQAALRSLLASMNKSAGVIDPFNTFNVSSLQTVRSSNFGTAAYLQPATILDGRTFRAGVQLSF